MEREKPTRGRLKKKEAKRKINKPGAKMQKEEEETNETNRRKRIRNESPDYLIQSSHCLCWSGQGGKPISVFFLVLFRLQMPWQISHPLPCLRPCSNPNHDNVWRKHVLRRVRAASRRITHFGAG